MKRYRFSLGVLALASAIVLGGSVMPASAYDCETNPQCQPNPDETGCCDPDTCTLKTSGQACRDEDIYENAACKKGTCNASGNCVPNGNNATSGKCIDHGDIVGGVEQVSASTNPCTMGTCGSGGVCNTTSSNSEPRCTPDGESCTEECFLGGGSPNVYVCGTNTTLLNGLDCWGGTVDACFKAQCQNGACTLNPSAPVDCHVQVPTVPACYELICNPAQSGGGCALSPTPGESCDTNPDDCIENVCKKNTPTPTCLDRNEKKGKVCAPGDGNTCTNDYCNRTGDCNQFIAKPNDPQIACSGPQCRDWFCYNGNCTGFAIHPDGEACNDNNTPCLIDQCLSGVCDHSTAKPDGTACPDNNTPCKTDQCISGACNHQANSPYGEGCLNLHPCMQSICNGGGSCGVPTNLGQPCSVYCTESGICDAAGKCDATTCKANTVVCNYCGGTCNTTVPPTGECTCG